MKILKLILLAILALLLLSCDNHDESNPYSIQNRYKQDTSDIEVRYRDLDQEPGAKGTIPSFDPNRPSMFNVLNGNHILQPNNYSCNFPEAVQSLLDYEKEEFASAYINPKLSDPDISDENKRKYRILLDDLFSVDRAPSRLVMMLDKIIEASIDEVSASIYVDPIAIQKLLIDPRNSTLQPIMEKRPDDGQ